MSDKNKKTFHCKLEGLCFRPTYQYHCSRHSLSHGIRFPFSHWHVECKQWPNRPFSYCCCCASILPTKYQWENGKRNCHSLDIPLYVYEMRWTNLCSYVHIGRMENLDKFHGFYSFSFLPPFEHLLFFFTSFEKLCNSGEAHLLRHSLVLLLLHVIEWMQANLFAQNVTVSYKRHKYALRQPLLFFASFFLRIIFIQCDAVHIALKAIREKKNKRLRPLASPPPIDCIVVDYRYRFYFT